MKNYRELLGELLKVSDDLTNLECGFGTDERLFDLALEELILTRCGIDEMFGKEDTRWREILKIINPTKFTPNKEESKVFQVAFKTMIDSLKKRYC